MPHQWAHTILSNMLRKQHDVYQITINKREMKISFVKGRWKTIKYFKIDEQHHNAQYCHVVKPCRCCRGPRCIYSVYSLSLSLSLSHTHTHTSEITLLTNASAVCRQIQRTIMSGEHKGTVVTAVAADNIWYVHMKILFTVVISILACREYSIAGSKLNVQVYDLDLDNVDQSRLGIMGGQLSEQNMLQL